MKTRVLAIGTIGTLAFVLLAAACGSSSSSSGTSGTFNCSNGTTTCLQFNATLTSDQQTEAQAACKVLVPGLPLDNFGTGACTGTAGCAVPTAAITGGLAGGPYANLGQLISNVEAVFPNSSTCTAVGLCPLVEAACTTL